MSTLLQVMHPAAFEKASVALASALIAGLWQGIALALLTAFTLRLLPRTTATARFVVWTAVFAASATMPLVHLINLAHPAGAAASSHLLLDPRWSYFLASLWIGTALCRLIMLAVEAFGLRQLWRNADPIDVAILLRAGVKDVVTDRRIEVCATSEVDRPSVIGFFAPRILIPTWLLANLSHTELGHIVLHEAEHLRRRDDWLNLLQRIGLVLFPLNPAMFWIDRRLATEREIACDDGVLVRTNTPRAYASSLASVAERRLGFRSSQRMLALALGVFGAGFMSHRRSEFARRIESILGRRPTGSPALATVLVAAICAGAAGLAKTPEFVSFGHTDAPQEITQATSALKSVPENSSASSTAVLASFQNVSFGRHSHSHRIHRQPLAKASAQPLATSLAVAHRNERPSRDTRPEWLVLASFEQRAAQHPAEANDANDPRLGDVVIPVSRMLVCMPDGKVFVAPYAAVPIQAGWLIIQL